MFENNYSQETHRLTPTRRHALKLAGGATVAISLGTAPTTAQQQNREQWAFDPDDGVGPSTTVVDGTAFIGSGNNNLYALDTETGEQRWAFETEGSVGYYPPTVVDGTVFVSSSDGNIYSVDAETGEQQQMYQTVDYVPLEVTVFDDTIIAGNSKPRTNETADVNAGYYALDIESGERQWFFPMENTADAAASPTVVDGTVYLAANHLYAVDIETGEQQWVFETPKFHPSSPTVADGTVFVGCNDSNLYAVDANTGQQQWAFETVGRIWSSPTVHDNTIFFGSFNQGDPSEEERNSLYAVDVESGEQQWVFQNSWQTFSSPTVADGSVYFVGYDGNLYSVDAETGEQYWAFETGDTTLDRPAPHNAPLIVDGTVYFTTRNKLYAIQTEIDGSSEGSRVNLGTLGHHHVWANRAVGGGGNMDSTKMEDQSQSSDETDSDESGEGDTSTSAPGFGVLSSLTALGSVGYMIKRRLTDEQSDR